MNHLLARFILILIVSASSLPIVAVDPEAEENDAAASSPAVVSGMRLAAAASSQFPLEKMSFEMQEEILLRLSPKEVNNLACASKVMEKIVSGFRTHCREVYQAHVRAGIREGLHAHESNPAGYGLPMFASRAEMEARMPPQKLRQVSPEHKEEVWKEEVLFGENI